MTEFNSGGLGGFDPLQVNLSLFDGPLDLLLHLVRKQALDINELRLAELTEPYLAYLEQMQEFNLDQAGEFLAIAATLVWIKSKTLLPGELAPDEPDAETVEEMLVLRLQEYQAFRDAAHRMGDRELLGRDVFPRQPGDPEGRKVEPDAAFEEVSLIGLIDVFREVLARAEAVSTLNVVPDHQRMEEKVEQLLAMLRAKRSLYFSDLFSRDATRAEIILTFITLLELVRLRAIRVVQTADEIFCQVTDSFAASDTDWKELLLGSLAGDQGTEEINPA